jgi:hypothetical protein
MGPEDSLPGGFGLGGLSLLLEGDGDVVLRGERGRGLAEAASAGKGEDRCQQY